MATNLTLMQQFLTLFNPTLAKWHLFAHSAMVTDGSRLHSYQKSRDAIASENVGSLWTKILAYSVSLETCIGDYSGKY